MKLLMKIFSVILVAFMIVFFIGTFGDLGTDFTLFYLKMIAFLGYSIIPIITICVSCANSKKTEKWMMMSIIMAIAIFTIILTAIMTFAPLEDMGETFTDVILSIWNFLNVANSYLLLFALIYSVRPNNVICKVIRMIGFGAIGINLIIQIIVMIQSGLISTLPNDYGDAGFNFAFSLSEGNEIATTIYSVSTIVLIFSVILTYITNYAFEIDVIEADNLDYTDLKKQADLIVQSKIDDLYKPKEVEFVPDRSASEKGLMNVSNQLGVDSNVGQVTGPLQNQNTFVDKAIPTSSGPVINQSLNSQLDVPNTQQEIIQPMSQTEMPPISNVSEAPALPQVTQPMTEVQQMPNIPNIPQTREMPQLMPQGTEMSQGKFIQNNDNFNNLNQNNNLNN